jgi:hypothetical protein
MNLHKVVASLLEAQNRHDREAYSECFSETAIVHDERMTYTGKAEIRRWIEKSDHEYHTELKPLGYKEEESLLTAEVTGNFPGSPAILQFHFSLKDGLISTLRITG